MNSLSLHRRLTAWILCPSWIWHSSFQTGCLLEGGCPYVTQASFEPSAVLTKPRPQMLRAQVDHTVCGCCSRFLRLACSSFPKTLMEAFSKLINATQTSDFIPWVSSQHNLQWLTTQETCQKANRDLWGSTVSTDNSKASHRILPRNSWSKPVSTWGVGEWKVGDSAPRCRPVPGTQQMVKKYLLHE